MRCFELFEKVRRGIPVAFPYLYLGHPGTSAEEPFPANPDDWSSARWATWQRALVEGEASAPYARIPLGTDWRAWMTQELGSIPPGERVILTRAILQNTLEGGLRIEQEEEHDGRALVLVRTAPGEGGTITYRYNSRVQCVFQLDEDPDQHEHDYACTDRLFVMREGGLLRVQRTGELEGAPEEFILGWGGSWMHELHHTVSPKWRTMSAALQKTEAAPPVRRLRGALRRLTPQPA